MSNVDDYLHRVEARNAPKTLRTRRSDLGRYTDYLNREGLDPTDVTAKNVDDFLIEEMQQFEDDTVKSRWSTLKQFYDFVADLRDEMDKNPFDNLKRSDYTGNGASRKSEEDGIVYVSKNEMETLCTHAPNPKFRNELIIRLLWQTGMRASEIVNVEIENVERDPEDPHDPRRIRVYSPKTSQWRNVFYQPSLDSLMDRWLDSLRPSYRTNDSPYLFVTNRSEQLHPKTVTADVVAKAAERAGIQETIYTDASGHKRRRITAHALRHGHAVYSLKSGIDVRTVADSMGHSDLETTMRYLDLIEDDVRKAYERWGFEQN